VACSFWQNTLHFTEIPFELVDGVHKAVLTVRIVSAKSCIGTLFGIRPQFLSSSVVDVDVLLRLPHS
jgi:hypothetical protein